MNKRLLFTLVIAGLFLSFHQSARTQTNPAPLRAGSDGSREASHAPVFRAGQKKGLAGEGAFTEADVRAAAAKAIKLIQRSQQIWATKETCSSCHHQLLPEIPLSLARQRGVSVDETIARDATASAFGYLKDFDDTVQGYGYIDVYADGWGLVSAAAAGVPASLSTAAAARFVASRQRPDGIWNTIDDRPPQSHSRFSATAVCIQAVQQYLPEQLKAEKQARVRRAREWLLKAQPLTTEDEAFQLLGLGWTGAEVRARAKAGRRLLGEQRQDGGWSQLPGLASDAYSTGEVLFALREGAGLATTDPACQRALWFLLNDQQADGSWHVKSRLHPPAPVSPPYFETGFPYQHDQFISAMGTSWSAAALLQAVPPQAKGAGHSPAVASIAPDEDAEWMRAALFGSAAALKRLLDTGMKPDMKTREGTTALMLAAHDLEKVKLLIGRGADVNARAASGFTALMVASRFTGNAETVRLLLEKGAKPNADQGVEVRNDASALFFAVTADDVASATALLDAGARLNAPMKLIGRVLVSPLNYATSGGGAKMVEYLISKGANPNEQDGDGISLLGWATINNHVDVVRALVGRGADVNHVDNFGMTPVLYAASIDFGNTAVLEALIAAGADLRVMNKQGHLALDLAKTYRYERLVNLLTRKGVSR